MWLWKEDCLQLGNGENVDTKDSSVAKGHGRGVRQWCGTAEPSQGGSESPL